jgi:hypothetical protein
MTRSLALLAFLPAIAISQTLALTEGTHRKTFDGQDATSRTAACKIAKDKSSDWIERSQGISLAIFSTTTSQAECNCERPPSRIVKNVCPGGTPICDASRLIDVTVEEPWSCIVDASVTNKKK